MINNLMQRYYLSGVHCLLQVELELPSSLPQVLKMFYLFSFNIYNSNLEHFLLVCWVVVERNWHSSFSYFYYHFQQDEPNHRAQQKPHLKRIQIQNV